MSPGGIRTRPFLVLAGLVALLLSPGGRAAWAQMEPTPTPIQGDGVLFGTVFEKTNNTITPGPVIAEAHVVVFLDVESFAPMPPLASVRTNSEGKYRVENLPTGPEQPLRVVVEKMNYYPAHVNGIVIPAGAEVRRDFFLVPRPAEPTPTPLPTPTTGTLARISGTVVGLTSSGAHVPLAGAHVEVRAGEAEITIYPPPPPVAVAFTNEQGFYQMMVPADLPLPSRIIAGKTGYEPQVKRIEALPAEGLVVNFALIPRPEPTQTPPPPPRDGFIYGVVYDVTSSSNDTTTTPAGVPLPGAVVTVWLSNTLQEPQSAFPIGHAITDELGRYRIEELPTGIPLLARATKEGYTVAERRIEGLTSEGLRVNFAIRQRILPSPTPTPTAPPPGETGICGHVVEESMLTVYIPIPGALVEVFAANRTGDGTASGEGSDPYLPPPVASTVTDENGQFCIVPLGPGWYYVRASADHYWPTIRQAHVEDGSITRVGLALKPMPTPTVTPTPNPNNGAIGGVVMTAVPEGSLMPIRPIPGVEVLAFPLPIPTGVDETQLGDDAIPMPPAGRAFTNENGEYLMRDLPAGPYVVVARKVGFYPQKKDAEVSAGERTELNFELMFRPEPTPTMTPPPPPPDAGAIRGLVFNALAMSPRPAPIAGAEVLVFPAQRPAEGTESQPIPILGRTVTNDEGLYHIGNLPPVPVVVKAFKQGYTPGAVRADVQPSNVTLVNIGLVPVQTTPTPTPPPSIEPARVYGHVMTLGADGQRHPVPEAKVCLFAPDSTTDSDIRPQPVACAVTDSLGRYFLVARPGEYAAVASAVGFQREIKRVSLVSGPNEPVNFLLERALEPTPPPPPPVGLVAGVVVEWQNPYIDAPDSLPRPIPNALVSLYKADRMEGRFDEPTTQTRTDEAGRFVFERVPACLLVGVAEKRGFERDVKTLVVQRAETTHVGFVLKPLIVEPTPIPVEPGALAGRVLAAATDDVTTHAIAGALITAYRINRNDMVDLAARPAGVAVTDADGLWHMGGLLPGEYLVVAVARGFEPGRVHTFVRSGETTRVRIVLVPAAVPDPTAPGAIVGRVMTPSALAMENQGPPLADRLALDPVEGSTVTTYLVVLDQADPALLTPSGQAVTDAEGKFEIAPLQPGVHLVVAKAEGLLPAVQLARVRPEEATRLLIVLRNTDAFGIRPLPPEELVGDDEPVDTDPAHWEPVGSDPFTRPITDRRNGWLILRSHDNANCFGYWQSVRGWIPRRPDSLYAVSFTVASDQAEAEKSPSLRLRVNSDSLRQTDIFRVNSMGNAGLAPTLEGTSYRLYFEPMELGEVDAVGRDGLNVAFDLLNFDRNDAAEGELTLTSLAIDAIPLETLEAGTVLKEWTFDAGDSGWTAGGAPGAFDVPDAVAADGALQLRARRQGNVFGFWSSPADDFQAPWTGALLRATFRVAGNQIDPSVVTQLRVRLNSADGQAAVLKVVPSIGDGANSPTAAGKDYRVYFEVPPALVGQGLIASVDLLGFDPRDAADNAILLENVKIEQVPAPVVE